MVIVDFVYHVETTRQLTAEEEQSMLDALENSMMVFSNPNVAEDWDAQDDVQLIVFLFAIEIGKKVAVR